ncbi:MAG TPA: sensor histidine kinase [Candidatus Merdivicinus faecavium]|nr:sensor histidine kinase [Candidatus Merdivicinus faecavium]
MRHIKTRMLLFTSMAIFLSCLLCNLISTAMFSRLYLEELYRSCESQALQILQSVDQKVQSLEDSIQLILTGEGVMRNLSQTDFSHPDGQVYSAYLETDWVMQSFQHQFPQFMGLLFCNSGGSFYFYNYYNPDTSVLDAFFEPEYVKEISGTDRFHWEGVRPIQNRIARENAYIVTHSFVDYQNLRSLGVALILLEEDVFSSIYQPIVETSGASVYLFDETGSPVETYGEEELGQLAESLPASSAAGGEVFQTEARDNDSLLTVTRSAETGWSLCLQIPLGILTDSMQRLILLNGVIAVGIMLLLGLIQIRYLSRITDDITRISDAMKVIEANDFSLRLHTDRRDEIGLIYAGFNVMAENLGKYFRKAVEEEKSRNQAEIRAMFYQIKPHFLYNTLASIRMYAMKQGCGEIVDMLGTLNRLLRNTINIRDHFITLEEELQNLKDYIKIYSVRYNGRIRFSLCIPAELMACRIPNMILQPIVENAIEHGVSGNIAGGLPAGIDIRASRQGERLLLQVRDNGAGMTDMELAAVMRPPSEPEKDGHIGLHNIDSRLKSLYGGGYGVQVESVKGEYTCVTLTVQLRDRTAEGGGNGC